MNNKKIALNFCKLPIVLAISSTFIGCSSTTPTNNGTKVTTVPASQWSTVNRNKNSQTTGNQAAVATNEAVSQIPATDGGYSNALLDDDSLEELANLLEATDMTMVENDKLAIQQYGDLWDRMRAGFAINQTQLQFNPRIEAQKSWFTSRQDYINRLTARASRYLYHTVKEAERRNIPTELALLPVIESSYDPTATSNASAAGMWQFIPSTGRIYGLTQTPNYDGRRDVVESTRAAYDFLTSLYNQFGSWELALAAYNAGPGRIQGAIDANKSRGLPTDYWSLDLPKETMNYVPRFMAVAQIVNDADRYGIYLPAIANRQHFRSVPVKFGVSLQEVAQITGEDYEELRMLNPALTSARVDIAGPNRIIIPNSIDSQIDAQLSQLTGNGVAQPYTPNIPDSQYAVMAQSPEGLAEFASKARAPQQNDSYIRPATPVGTEPVISANEKQFINSQFASSNTLPTTSAALTSNATIVQEPPLSAEEKAFIAAQIQSQTPDVGQVVSPIDGNVKLAAVQTQQSILQASGQDKRLSFESAQPTFTTPVTTSTTNSPMASSAPSSTPKGKRSVYTVKGGDTLSKIASRAGLNWRDIADWNQINPNSTLLAGTKLYLYNAKPITQNQSSGAAANSVTPTSKGSASAPTQVNSYIVRSGDTLIGTANRVGLSVTQLAKYNDLATNARLQKGQKLWLIPGMTKTSANTAANSTTSPSKYEGKTQVYTVKRGESLIGLASKFDVPLTTLASMNDLNSTDQLLIGQRLTIPAVIKGNTASTQASDKTVTSQYKVAAGDTLIGIANKIKVSHTKIATINNFSPNTKLQKGQVILLPINSQQLKQALSKPPLNKTAANNVAIDYKVKSGDTLIGVANKFGVSTRDLASANNLSSSSHLIKGNTLNIPNSNANSASSRANTSQTQSNSSSNPSSTTHTSSTTNQANQYTVKSGDSLIGLAKKHGVSTKALAKANGLSSNAQLQIGQKISVPATTTRYKVVAGDNLISLAKKYGMSAKQFADLNGIESDTMLKIGQVLKVPVQ